MLEFNSNARNINTMKHIYMILVSVACLICSHELMAEISVSQCSVAKPKAVSNLIKASVKWNLSLFSWESDLARANLDLATAKEFERYLPVDLSLNAESRTTAESGSSLDLAETKRDELSVVVSMPINPYQQYVERLEKSIETRVAELQFAIVSYEHEIEVLRYLFEYQKAHMFTELYTQKRKNLRENLSYLEELAGMGEQRFFERRNLRQSILDTENLIVANDQRKLVIARQFGLNTLPDIEVDISESHLTDFNIQTNCFADGFSLRDSLLSTLVEQVKTSESVRNVSANFSPSVTLRFARDPSGGAEDYSQLIFNYRLNILDGRAQERLSTESVSSLIVLQRQRDSLVRSIQNATEDSSSAIDLYSDVMRSTLRKIDVVDQQIKLLEERKLLGDAVFSERINLILEKNDLQVQLVEHYSNIIERWLSYWKEFMSKEGVFLHEAI